MQAGDRGNRSSRRFLNCCCKSWLGCRWTSMTEMIHHVEIDAAVDDMHLSVVYSPLLNHESFVPLGDDNDALRVVRFQPVVPSLVVEYVVCVRRKRKRQTCQQIDQHGEVSRRISEVSVDVVREAFCDFVNPGQEAREHPDAQSVVRIQKEL